ncbi:MAG: hypothetical protein GEU80_17845 [Dehalococcoidia bacterium]|nr:hypothetical protein [Dehalococcoidia bacterium]
MTTTASHTETDDTRRPASCVHHWFLETPDGPESRGTCSRCGIVKSFPNTPPRLTRSEFRVSNEPRSRGVRSSRRETIQLADESSS